MKKLMIGLAVLSISVLSGCVSEQQRVDRCVATGVSRDTCYHEEKEYWRAVNANYATERAAETQADAFREGMGNNDHKKEKSSKLGKFFGY
ncbi:TPA: hypothetical protein R1R37_005207 [Klebsiella aerogenes]|uniref:hypothetical protein n=1 Tax=Klebsiella TaxID=570 RepID=UPI0006591D5B|nr:hypothetical protein [Klebsiella aerogenes]EIV2482809.1 hypothetical protein [Klebsiella aerogenes]EJL5447785.1 hypothetical protein [Klebsiella aerogenes]EKY1835263.1 hypothetical protein [Klebsiella aerogenes]EKZ3166332.1 hypothetical protein [Klebsiella aerogenes]EKZ6402787.1 hypothetical protein [Klebsiella aerogenes]